MDDDEFEDALARAVHGEVLTDLDCSAAMLEALIRVAAARTVDERRPALRAARRRRTEESAPDPGLTDPETRAGTP